MDITLDVQGDPDRIAAPVLFSRCPVRDSLPAVLSIGGRPNFRPPIDRLGVNAHSARSLDIRLSIVLAQNFCLPSLPSASLASRNFRSARLIDGWRKQRRKERKGKCVNKSPPAPRAARAVANACVTGRQAVPTRTGAGAGWGRRANKPGARDGHACPAPGAGTNTAPFFLYLWP